jgi:Flp pilus assembly protein TadG
MMKRLDDRGAAAFEFCVVAIAFFLVLFTIFEVGRYMITVQSLRALASAGARATIIKCYTPNVTDDSTGTTAATCTDIDTYLPEADRPDFAPFLYGKGDTVTLATVAEANALTITATATFTPVLSMVQNVWTLPTPTATTKIPF